MQKLCLPSPKKKQKYVFKLNRASLPANLSINQEPAAKTVKDKITAINSKSKPKYSKESKKHTNNKTASKKKVKQLSPRPKSSNSKHLKHKKGSPSSYLANSKKSSKIELSQSKKLDSYLKHKLHNESGKVVSCFESTNIFHPITHEKQIHHSFLLSDNENNESQFHSQVLNGLASQQTYKIPPIYQKFYDEQENAKLEDPMLTKEQWQAFETIKLRNQELSNYIQELEKIEGKLIKQNELRQKQIEREFMAQQQELIKQIQELKYQQQRLGQTNAELQQMFNEGQQNSMKLERDLHSTRQKIDKLSIEKQLIQNKYISCCREKETIKAKAQSMLTMVHNMCLARQR